MESVTRMRYWLYSLMICNSKLGSFREERRVSNGDIYPTARSNSTNIRGELPPVGKGTGAIKSSENNQVLIRARWQRNF